MSTSGADLQHLRKGNKRRLHPTRQQLDGEDPILRQLHARKPTLGSPSRHARSLPGAVEAKDQGDNKSEGLPFIVDK